MKKPVKSIHDLSKIALSKTKAKSLKGGEDIIVIEDFIQS